MQRMYVVPRYDPVYVEPNLKEYETQVLQMSVPVDDNDSYNDLQIDFSNTNHAFSLDNVSYITKDQNSSTGKNCFAHCNHFTSFFVAFHIVFTFYRNVQSFWETFDCEKCCQRKENLIGNDKNPINILHSSIYSLIVMLRPLGWTEVVESTVSVNSKLTANATPSSFVVYLLRQIVNVA